VVGLAQHPSRSAKLYSDAPDRKEQDWYLGGQSQTAVSAWSLSTLASSGRGWSSCGVVSGEAEVGGGYDPGSFPEPPHDPSSEGSSR